MRIDRPDVRNIAICSAVCPLIVVFLPIPLLQTIAGLALALYLPGRAMSAGLFNRGITRTEEAAISVGLSLCVTIIGGFILHFANAMTAPGWAAFLAGFSLAACGLIQHFGAPPRRGAREIRFFSLTTRKDRAALVTAAFFVLLSYTIASAGLQRYPFFSYTELSLVPAPARPRDAVQIAFRNREGAGQNYTLELHTGAELVARWSAIHLEPDETWTKVAPLSAETVPGRRIEARLYKDSKNDTLYRRVWLVGSK